jgi:hypothetical protein
MTVELEQADDPTALTAVGLEQVDHLVVGSPWSTGKRPRDGVPEVEVTHRNGIGIAERTGEDDSDRPLADTAQAGQPAGDGGVRKVAPRPEVMCVASNLDEGFGASPFDTERMKSPTGQRSQALGGRREPEVVTRPRRSITELAAQLVPLSVGLDGGDALCQNCWQQLVIERSARPEANVGVVVLGPQDGGVRLGEPNRMIERADHCWNGSS